MSRRMMMAAGGADEASWPYLMLTSTSDNTVTFSNIGVKLSQSWRPHIYYSYDGDTWSDFGYTGTHSETVSFSKNKPVYIRGTGISGEGIGGSTYDEDGNFMPYSGIHFVFAGDGQVSCYGNIYALVSEVSEDDNLPDNCFYRLFYDCTKLVRSPSLWWEKLAVNCYGGMFYGCSSFRAAPALPSMTLYASCYDDMFHGCIALKDTPELPATTVPYGCYKNMFCECTGLVTAKDLPSATLGNMACAGMFSGCTSLLHAPKLPSLVLAAYCYSNMFYGCTSLVNAPELPATSIADYCYNSMFKNCSSLIKAPLIAYSGGLSFTNCYTEMFRNCKKLSYVKALFSQFNGTATRYWLDDVSSTGTFVKNSLLTVSDRGESFIPSNWTIESVEI